LRTWAEASGTKLQVAKDTSEAWTITVMVSSPVMFSGTGWGIDIDEAATKVIDDLTTVGVSIP
jgi:hypothetical protein